MRTFGACGEEGANAPRAPPLVTGLHLNSFFELNLHAQVPLNVLGEGDGFQLIREPLADLQLNYPDIMGHIIHTF